MSLQNVKRKRTSLKWQNPPPRLFQAFALTLWPGSIWVCSPWSCCHTPIIIPHTLGQKEQFLGFPSDCKSWAGWLVRRFSVAETWAGSSREPRGAESSILGLSCQSSQYRRLSDIFIRNLCSTWSRFFFLLACFLPSPGCPPSFHLKSIRPSRFSFPDYSSMVFSPLSETPPMASCQYRNHMLFWFPQARG